MTRMPLEPHPFRLGRAGVVLLVLTAVLRFVGFDHGMPFWLINDEQTLVGGALRMLELRTLVPSFDPRMAFLYYPPGMPYLYLVLFAPVLSVWWLLSGLPAPAQFGDIVLSDLTPVWLVARAASVAFAVGTTYVILRLTSEVTRDRRVALLAALAFAVSYHHALFGHFARIWPVTTFFYWLGIWAAWRHYVSGSRRAYGVAAVAAGLGFAVNYIGVLSAASTGVAHLLRHRRVVIDRSILMFTGIVLAFIVVFALLYWQNFMRLMGYSALLDAVPGAMPGTTVPQPPLPHGHNVSWYSGSVDFLRAFWRNEPAVLVLGALGVPLLARRHPQFLFIALAALVLHFLVFVTGFVREDRYILPITVLFMISGAALVVRVAAKRAIVLALGVVALTGMSLAATVQLDRLLLRSDTRQLARAFVLQHATDGEGVVNLMPRVFFEPTLESVRDQRDLIAPDSLTYLQRRQLAGGAVDSGGGGRRIATVTLVLQSEWALRGRDLTELYDELLRRGYRWAPLSADVAAEGRDGFVELLRRRGRLVHVIDPGAADAPQPNQWTRPPPQLLSLFKISHFGPRVEIWRLDQ